MNKIKIIGSLFLFLCFIYCQGCCPFFKEVEVNNVRASSTKRSFIVDCGERIKIKWQVENEHKIDSQYIKFLYPSPQPGETHQSHREELDPTTRTYSFTFKRPVTVQLTVKCDDKEKSPDTIWFDFLLEDYYFRAKLQQKDEFKGYPLLGDLDLDEGWIDFVDFVAFYDTGEPGVIDYFKHSSSDSAKEGPYRARTNGSQEYIEGNNRFFPMLSGYHYEYDDNANAAVFGGTFAKSGERIITVKTDKGEVTIKEGTPEEVQPIFCALMLSDYGEWRDINRASSNPNIIDAQLGNLAQGLVLLTYKNYLDSFVEESVSIGGITNSTVDRSSTSNQRGIIYGGLKGSIVGFRITTLDGEFDNKPVFANIEDAIYRMPYLQDTDNLSSPCGE